METEPACQSISRHRDCELLLSSCYWVWTRFIRFNPILIFKKKKKKRVCTAANKIFTHVSMPMFSLSVNIWLLNYSDLFLDSCNCSAAKIQRQSWTHYGTRWWGNEKIQLLFKLQLRHLRKWIKSDAFIKKKTQEAGETIGEVKGVRQWKQDTNGFFFFFCTYNRGSWCSIHLKIMFFLHFNLKHASKHVEFH